MSGQSNIKIAYSMQGDSVRSGDGSGGGGEMDGRLIKLETQVEHVKSGIDEIKTDVKALRGTFDGRVSILQDKIDGVKESLSSARIWALLLYIGFAGGLLFVLARGFKWI
jgi:hypothetical protein